MRQVWAIAIVTLGVLTAACGQKGPLVLPDAHKHKTPVRLGPPTAPGRAPTPTSPAPATAPSSIANPNAGSPGAVPGSAPGAAPDVAPTR